MVLMKFRTGGVAIAAFALVFSACSAESDDADSAAESPEAITVTASFYPLEYLAEEIGGDHVAVTSLTPAGSDAHNLELSPRQVSDLEKSDLVLYLSEFQTAMDDAVATASPDHVIDAREVISLSGEHTHYHGDDHDGDEHTEGEADDHSEGDPHFWLDPSLMADLAPAVADELAGIDPDNAAEYQANAEALVEKLHALDENYHSTLEQCEHTSFIVTHEAFGYIESAYGLEQIGIAGIETDTEPSPARVAEVLDLIEDNGTTAIFATSEAESTIAHALASEAGVDVGVLDAGATQIDEAVDYEGIMNKNLDMLASHLQCR